MFEWVINTPLGLKISFLLFYILLFPFDPPGNIKKPLEISHVFSCEICKGFLIFPGGSKGNKWERTG